MKQNLGSRIFGKLQQLGPCMIPVLAIMPIAGLFIALGALLTDPTVVAVLPFLNNGLVTGLCGAMIGIGNFINGNLHILFAICVASGFTKHDGIGAMCGALGFLVMHKTIEVVGGITAEMSGTQWHLYSNVFGINTLSMGVFGGILSGAVTAWVFNKVKDVKLPSAISFFNGKRAATIMVIVVSMLLALPVNLIWPHIQGAIGAFGEAVCGQDTAWWSSVVLTIGMRLLLPFGLHTLIWVPITNQFGTFVNSAGEVFHGAYPIYYAQLADGAELTTYYWLAGNYLAIFCLCAVASAFIFCAKPEKKKATAGQMIPGMITAALAGVSEPIEFSYVFSAFPVYAVHALFYACTGLVAKLAYFTVGTGSWGGAVDFILYGVIQGNPTWWKLIPLGLGMFALEFAVITFMLKKFNFKVPGNMDDDDVAAEDVAVYGDSELATKVLAALGGGENLNDVDACATRLRLCVVDPAKVDQKKLKALGAAGVAKVGNNFQVIFGDKAILLKSQIQAIKSGKKVDAKAVKAAVALASKEEDIVVPVDGELIDLKKVPDQVIAEGMLGAGYAVIPSNGNVLSPVNGVVTRIFETKHAITITSDAGKEVLVHMGIDTVKMNGVGFEVLVNEEQIVSAGTPLAKMDLAAIKAANHDTSVCVVFTNVDDKNVVLTKTGAVKANTPNLVKLVEKKD